MYYIRGSTMARGFPSTSTKESKRRGGERRGRESPTECAGQPVVFDSYDTHGSGRGSS
jgi:hypothetical protein